MSGGFDNFFGLPYLVKDNQANYEDDVEQLSVVDVDDDVIYASVANYITKRGTVVDDSPLISLDNTAYDSLVSNERMYLSLIKNNDQLINALENRMTNLENNVKYNESIKQILTEDISLTNIDISALEQDLHYKSRLADIKQYYDKKMTHQVEIVKNLVFICLVLLIFSLAYKFGVLSDGLFASLIGIGLFIMVAYTVASTFDIFIRDDVDYDEYKYIRSHHYLNKGNGGDIENDIPLHERKDLMPNKCYYELTATASS